MIRVFFIIIAKVKCDFFSKFIISARSTESVTNELFVDRTM